ncbi:transposable element Tcb2 transposase [Trichonephila clavipes]|nr:transposable element Tcb2 transposase [Trichonephila clavipes]
MIAPRYVHDILVSSLMQRLPGALFQQDNARPHTARVSQDCLRTVTPLPWPARSPDLTPIEPIWDHLGCSIMGCGSEGALSKPLMRRTVRKGPTRAQAVRLGRTAPRKVISRKPTFRRSNFEISHGFSRFSALMFLIND